MLRNTWDEPYRPVSWSNLEKWQKQKTEQSHKSCPIQTPPPKDQRHQKWGDEWFKFKGWKVWRSTEFAFSGRRQSDTRVFDGWDDFILGIDLKPVQDKGPTLRHTHTHNCERVNEGQDCNLMMMMMMRCIYSTAVRDIFELIGLSPFPPIIRKRVGWTVSLSILSAAKEDWDFTLDNEKTCAHYQSPPGVWSWNPIDRPKRLTRQLLTLENRWRSEIES